MKIKRIGIVVILLLTVVIGKCSTAVAEDNVPYETYNYDYWEDVYYTPAAYVPDKSYSGIEIGSGTWNNPQDFCVAEDGRIYVADTGNNRIVVLNSLLQFVKTIDGFINEGIQDTFNSPTGLSVSAKNELYIADTNNKRVVVLDVQGNLVKILSNPTADILGEDFEFNPLKICVDYADRVYVVSKNMFQGIMAFDTQGDFTGFTGTINVTVTLYDKIWRKLSTKAQRARQSQFIPTEFTGLDIDPDGFLYATNIDAAGKQSVRRLNPKGQDVIKKNSTKTPISGDFYFRIVGDYSGASRIVDIVYRDNGIYSVIDTTRGRIFTYDHEGNLLYIFGGRGSQRGTFKNPVAIEEVGDKVYVLDSGRNEIMSFKESEYGRLINDAVALRYEGDEKSAVELWKQVLELDSNFELAYVGIGKANLSAGENKEAMKYLKLGMNREYYSIAFKRYRNEILKDNLGYVLTGLAVLLIVLWITKIVMKVKKNKKGKVKVE